MFEKPYYIDKKLFFHYRKLKLKEKELLVIFYFLNQDNNILDYQQMSKDLNWKIDEVLTVLDDMKNKKIIEVKIKKQNKKQYEVFELDGLKHLLERIEKEKSDTIYHKSESQFGRTLSPIEYELISIWAKKEISEELMEIALNEAVFNGAFNLKYVDKILLNFEKKGIKNKKDFYENKKSTNQEDKIIDRDIEWL